MTTLPGVTPLCLLGVPCWQGAGRERRLERKMAALLAFLALEGVTPRTVVAGLLWPEVPEGTARGNLRQTLRRAREVLGVDALVGDDHLSLGAGVGVDVAALELAAFSGEDVRALSFEGELLGGHDFDDCAEFMEWLALQRERVLGLRREARTRLSETHEAAGEYGAALLHAEKLLELDPVSEVAHRRVMRLHYLRGDRGAALGAFGRCGQVLARELGVSPMPETLALARQIEGEEVLVPPVPARRAVPLSVQRPPRLIGREGAWDALERAWEAGQAVFIVGPAGVGKTRLAQDFLTSRGPYQVLEGQLGDASVPYLSLVRAFRQLLVKLPDLRLADWARAELSRVLPEFGGTRTPLTTSLTFTEDKLRFYEAQAQFMAAALRRSAPLLLIDDLHFHDEVSCEAWTYILSHPDVQACGMRAVFTFRPSELSAPRWEAVQAAVGNGQAALVEVQPFTPSDMAELLGTLGLPVPPDLAPALTRHTGGNPLFTLETLRSLIQREELSHADPQRLPLPRHLGPLFARRLERLSAPAGRLVSVAAVAGPDFTPELAGSVLDAHPLDLAAPWTELVNAQVLSEQDRGGFTHALLAQAALANLPAPIRALLHRRVATHLQGVNSEAARVAHHWQAAGEATQAAPWWLKAGQTALNRAAEANALDVFERALECAPPHHDDRLAALLGLGQTLLGRDPQQSAAHLQTALAEARAQGNTTREIQAQAALSEWHLLRGDLAHSHTLILNALKLVPAQLKAEQQQEVSELWRSRFWVELRSGRLPDAEHAITTAMTLAPTHPWLANERALLLWHTGRFREAAELYEQLMQAAPNAQNTEATLPWIANNMAWTYWALGRNAEAQGLLERTLTSPCAPFDRGLRLSNLSVIQSSTGQHAAALHGLQEARTLLHGYNLNMTDVLYRLGLLHYRADQYAPALTYFREATTLARQVGDLYRLTYTLATTAALEAIQKEQASAETNIQEALTLARHIQFPLASIITQQAASEITCQAGNHPAALQHAQQALHIAQHCHMPEHIGYGHLYTAQIPGPHTQDAFQTALNIGQTYHLPDLTWRAAQHLGQTNIVHDTRKQLREQSPPGWY